MCVLYIIYVNVGVCRFFGRCEKEKKNIEETSLHCCIFFFEGFDSVFSFFFFFFLTLRFFFAELSFSRDYATSTFTTHSVCLFVCLSYSTTRRG